MFYSYYSYYYHFKIDPNDNVVESPDQVVSNSCKYKKKFFFLFIFIIIYLFIFPFQKTMQ